MWRKQNKKNGEKHLWAIWTAKKEKWHRESPVKKELKANEDYKLPLQKWRFEIAFNKTLLHVFLSPCFLLLSFLHFLNNFLLPFLFLLTFFSKFLSHTIAFHYSMCWFQIHIPLLHYLLVPTLCSQWTVRYFSMKPNEKTKM